MESQTRTREEAVADMMDAFSRLANSYNGEFVVEKIYENLRTDHRTLQQSMVRIMFGVIEKIATDETYGTDGRNEQTKQICSEVVDLFNKKYNPDNIASAREIYRPSKFLRLI